MRPRTQVLLETFEELVENYRILKDEYEKVSKRVREIGGRVSAARALVVGEMEDYPNDKKLAAEIARIEAIATGRPQEQNPPQPATQPTLSIVETPPAASGASTGSTEKRENTVILINAIKETGNPGYTNAELANLLKERGTPLPGTIISNIIGKQIKREVMRKEGEKNYLTPLGMQYEPNKKARYLAAG